MKMKRLITVLVFLTLLLAVSCNKITIQPLIADAQSSKWEYAFVGGIVNGYGETVGTSLDDLNSAGQEGWEAVASYGNGVTLVKRRL